MWQPCGIIEPLKKPLCFIGCQEFWFLQNRMILVHWIYLLLPKINTAPTSEEFPLHVLTDCWYAVINTQPWEEYWFNACWMTCSKLTLPPQQAVCSLTITVWYCMSTSILILLNHPAMNTLPFAIFHWQLAMPAITISQWWWDRTLLRWRRDGPLLWIRLESASGESTWDVSLVL